jgi:hypothetical protein
MHRSIRGTTGRLFRVGDRGLVIAAPLVEKQTDPLPLLSLHCTLSRPGIRIARHSANHVAGPQQRSWVPRSFRQAKRSLKGVFEMWKVILRDVQFWIPVVVLGMGIAVLIANH